VNFIRKYNVALDLTTAGSLRIRIPIRKAGSADFAASGDWTPATGDVKVSKDGGAQASITALPSYSNGSWEFTLSAAELSARQIEVRVVDAATKAVDDEGFNVETFGNASAMFPTDYVDAVRLGLTALPNAAAQAVGGLYTRGTGAGQINQPTNGMIDVNTVWVDGAPIVPTATPALGSDNRVLVSIDVHASGLTIAGETGNTKQTGDVYALAAGGSGFAAIFGRTDVPTSSRLAPATAGRTIAVDTDGKVTTTNPARVVSVVES
jgi:hypothetical protein